MAQPTNKPRSMANRMVRMASHNIVIGDYCAFYWARKPSDCSVLDWPGPALDAWNKAIRLSSRYRTFKYYCQEEAPGWELVKKINYADNSVVRVEIDRAGTIRQVQEVPPHGDICY